jgi:hypothetical protein
MMIGCFPNSLQGTYVQEGEGRTTFQSITFNRDGTCMLNGNTFAIYKIEGNIIEITCQGFIATLERNGRILHRINDNGVGLPRTLKRR